MPILPVSSNWAYILMPKWTLKLHIIKDNINNNNCWVATECTIWWQACKIRMHCVYRFWAFIVHCTLVGWVVESSSSSRGNQSHSFYSRNLIRGGSKTERERERKRAVLPDGIPWMSNRHLSRNIAIRKLYGILNSWQGKIGAWYSTGRKIWQHWNGSPLPPPLPPSPPPLPPKMEGKRKKKRQVWSEGRRRERREPHTFFFSFSTFLTRNLDVSCASFLPSFSSAARASNNFSSHLEFSLSLSSEGVTVRTHYWGGVETEGSKIKSFPFPLLPWYLYVVVGRYSRPWIWANFLGNISGDLTLPQCLHGQKVSLLYRQRSS